MFLPLLITLALVFSADIFFSLAVIRNLRKYTLPGWTAARIVVPLYVGLSGLFFGFALYFLFHTL